MFNDERRKNANFILEKIKKYYPSFENPNEITISGWVDILDGYSQTEILEAFKNYRKYVPYNTVPNPANFKEYLHYKDNPETQATDNVQEAKCGDYSWNAMAADIEAGCCRNNLYVYKYAEKIVTSDWLLREIPADVWRKMSQQSRVKVALEKGLFNNFGEALRQAAQARFGRDYEFSSANDLENAKQYGGDSRFALRAPKNDGTEDVIGSLAAHWKVGA